MSRARQKYDFKVCERGPNVASAAAWRDALQRWRFFTTPWNWTFFEHCTYVKISKKLIK